MTNWFSRFLYLAAIPVLVFSPLFSSPQQNVQRGLIHEEREFVALVIGNDAYLKFDNIQSEATTATLLRVSCYDSDKSAVPVADFRNIPITK